MLTAASALALFAMLALSSAVFWFSGRFRLPYTVLLTLTGVLLVPLSAFGPLHFLREFSLTPELLFFIFLPTLLFESVFNINIRRVVEEAKPILLLAVVSLLVSAFAIGGALYFIFGLIGLQVPFAVTLLFGALISATDPVAVLSLFKEFGAPRRLTLIFEGESVANDATALALFLIALGLVTTGVTAESLAAGAITFVVMLVGGCLLGILVGMGMVRAIGYFRENEVVAVTLMIVLAHLTYLIAETLNETTAHLGFEFLKFSPIIATAAASLLLGNYGRYKVTPKAEEFVEKFWTQFAFMANSIVFILVGFLFASLPPSAGAFTVPVIIAILVVAIARALSIYGILIPYNVFTKKTAPIPLPWMHLLSWGSLRGALAVMMVLLVPATLVVPGWTLSISVQEFLLTLTVGCIFATLFIKAPIIGPLMRKLKIDAQTPLEKVTEHEARALIHGTTLTKLREFVEKGYVPKDIAENILKVTETMFAKERMALHSDSNQHLIESALNLYVLGFEKEELKELLSFNEITEHVFKRVNGKLTLQAEAIERGKEPDVSMTRDARDLFENAAEAARGALRRGTPEEDAAENLIYYRAQQILSRKVIKELTRIEKDSANPAFGKELIKKTIGTYEGYRQNAIQKADALRIQFPQVAAAEEKELAGRSVYRVKERYLERYYKRGLLTPKLFIKLRDEYEHEIEVRATQRGRT